MTNILEFIKDNPLVAVIAGAEVAFWVFIALGLAARYLLRMRKLGAALLICVPLIDVVMLVATVIDLRSGGSADITHGLAATYLGFSVAFGHSMIRWADVRFAHRFAGGPAPVKPPKYGPEKVKREWREWLKALLAWAIASGIMGAFVAIFGMNEQTRVFWEWPWGWIPRLTLMLGIWFVVGPLWVLLSPPRQPATSER